MPDGNKLASVGDVIPVEMAMEWIQISEVFSFHLLYDYFSTLRANGKNPQATKHIKDLDCFHLNKLKSYFKSWSIFIKITLLSVRNQSDNEKKTDKRNHSVGTKKHEGNTLILCLQNDLSSALLVESLKCTNS